MFPSPRASGKARNCDMFHVFTEPPSFLSNPELMLEIRCGKYEEISGKYEGICGKYEGIRGEYREIRRKYEEICGKYEEII